MKGFSLNDPPLPSFLAQCQSSFPGLARLEIGACSSFISPNEFGADISTDRSESGPEE